MLHDCIYEVTCRLRELNEDAYTPKAVSIGPFHHGSPRLRNKESEQRIFLRKFIQRWNIDLDSLIRLAEGLEPMVRNYYSENVTLSKEELIKIILVDAGFKLELFIQINLGDSNGNERLSLNSWLRNDVLRDLMLLENQLPFFALDRIFTSARPDNFRTPLPELLPREFRYLNTNPRLADRTPLHFTDLLRSVHLPQRGSELYEGFSNSESIKEEDIEHLYSVSELYDSGVRLKANRNTCLLDIKFSGGVLEIPTLEVVDSTEMLFRNMLAFEQCHYRYQSYIAEYTVILDHLINKERDVDLLVKKGIVSSLLGENNDVAKLVSGLGKNIELIELNSYYRLQWFESLRY